MSDRDIKSKRIEDFVGKECWEACKDNDLTCTKRSCRYWIKGQKQFNNCSLLAADKGPFTLQKVGDILGLTRMRVCQLEKRAIAKIESLIFTK